MKVLAYARTSWDEQGRGTFPSLEEQERALRSFADRTGLTLEKVYTDYGLSPTQTTRAGLISILDAMEEGWEAVLVTAPCRLTAFDEIDFDIVAELRTSEKRVLVADDETAAALSKVLAKRKKERRAEPPKKDSTRQRREIAQRLLKGREAGAKAGKHQSGPAPFGYRRDYSRRTTDGVLLVPDPEESKVVQLIFREYLRLRSMKRLIKLLDEQGLKTRRGKQWSRAGVSWILKNDTYIGRVHFGKIRVKGKHDSIVAPILFNKVQKLIKENNKRSRGGKKSAKPAASRKGAKKAKKAAPAEAAPAEEAEAEQAETKPRGRSQEGPRARRGRSGRSKRPVGVG